MVATAQVPTLFFIKLSVCYALPFLDDCSYSFGYTSLMSINNAFFIFKPEPLLMIQFTALFHEHSASQVDFEYATLLIFQFTTLFHEHSASLIDFEHGHF